MALPQMKERPSGVLSNTISKEASPESKCPICLDHFKNISYLDVCLHKFCFCCIHEWSKNKAECPLCKQPFNSIYHTIKSEDNYKRFDLRPTENGSFGDMAGQRFRYRTTLTGDRRPSTRRTSPLPDHGVLFEALGGSLSQQHNRDLHGMIRRFARRQSEGRSVRSLHEQEMIKFRRALYRRGARVQSVQDGGRTRETSAEFFKRNPACLHRLVPWLRRELTVLYGTHGSLVNIVQHIVMTLITRHNLADQAVQHELRPFLLSHTEHFLHEFTSFAQSPFNMEAYDERAVYDLPLPSRDNSSSEASVIAISEDESESLTSGSQDYATAMVTLSQTPWDDETPGPSYSSEPSQIPPIHVRDSDSDSSVEEASASIAAVPPQAHSADSSTFAMEVEHSSGNEEDCVIIGYVKPAADRTPELVQLSSDSENSELNDEPQTPCAPQHIRFSSESDLSPSATQQPSLRTTRFSPPHKNKKSRRLNEREFSCGSSYSNRAHNSTIRRKETNPSHWHSNSHYSQQDISKRCHAEASSSCASYYKSVCDHSHSTSHSIRQSRDCKDSSHSRRTSRLTSFIHQERRRSRSNSRNNSPTSWSRSCSGSSSRIKYTKHRDRSRSGSSSRTKFKSSNHDDRRHSRSNSRHNYSNREIRNRSISNSRINSSSLRKTSPCDENSRKRKYKSKHHDEPSKMCSSKLLVESVERAQKKNKKHHKKIKRKSRSRSKEDKTEAHSRKHHKKKKKHKKKSRRCNSERRVEMNSNVLITITSDNDNDDPSVPSTSYNSAASSTFSKECSATETQLLTSSFLDTEQQPAAGDEHCSVGDVGSHFQNN